MNLERENVIAELWKRLAAVETVKYTARNPSHHPSVADMPCIQFFEMDDVVEITDSRGSYPTNKRKMEVVVEPFINAETEGSSSKELGTFVQSIKKSIFAGGPTLGKRCLITETRAGRILRPPVGETVVGASLTFEIKYVEDVGKLFS